MRRDAAELSDYNLNIDSHRAFAEPLLMAFETFRATERETIATMSKVQSSDRLLYTLMDQPGSNCSRHSLVDSVCGDLLVPSLLVLSCPATAHVKVCPGETNDIQLWPFCCSLTLEREYLVWSLFRIINRGRERVVAGQHGL